ncbi:hypothetical protein [uncultured Dokdonia sp.]|uniref:hypothetical protein n=1 Tax=uncultured Dokdonia sp. TaxID=575653 RepID=UPI002606DBC9|nr:hypothetical protein [uncultured Dokdonia sp.]
MDNVIVFNTCNSIIYNFSEYTYRNCQYALATVLLSLPIRRFTYNGNLNPYMDFEKK